MAESATAPRSWLLWAVAVAGIGVLAGVLILGLASSRLDQPALRAFFVGWIVVPYVLSGVVAWWRRPASRLGPLMLLLGFTMALTPLQWSTQPLVHSIGQLFDMVPAAMFLHVFLAFPAGRLISRSERWIVGGCYAVTLGVQLIKIIVGVNPDSVFAMTDQGALGDVVEWVQLNLVAVCLLAGLVLLHRRRSPSGSARRPATLVVDAFSISLIMLAVLYLAGAFALPFVEVLRLITFAALGLAPVAFLYALLDMRLARGDAAGLLVELRDDPTTDLQAPLARALRDPSVRLHYWLPELGTWADQHGEPTADPHPDDDHALRILLRDKEPMAAVSFDRSLEDEHELLDTVLATAGIALENGRLRSELRARLQDLQGSRTRVLEAGRQERQRLERDLHDGAQVRLVALSLDLGLLGEEPDIDPSVKVRLHEARASVSASLQELREVAHGIYPAVLSGHGLGVALESLAARAPVPVHLDVRLPDRLPESVEVAVYYVVSEALANIGKHASATEAQVCVGTSGRVIAVEISDDGVGFLRTPQGAGLQGLTDRVEALGGRFQVGRATAGGVQVRAEIPCP
ncbi:sensor histidine kinase [Arthrobacter agilis]|uniref:sensor histidine kinase n=1 Tax=Arthrobacter agilis TaxID=37921 RepID=UPI00278748B1|nr:histidine kinase [Arthrobacter agilis]MDQ0736415.1 signal transduction histidine kinase [Arthrobacter agilis]